MPQLTSKESEYFSPVRKVALHQEQTSSGKQRSSKKKKKVSKAGKDTGMSTEFYELQIIYNDGGITIHVGSNQTVYDVMEIVCHKWLNILRNGDGLVDEHSWTVEGPPLIKSEYIYGDIYWDRRTMEWRDAHKICKQSNQMISANEKLKNIKGFMFSSLSVVYGVQCSTNFQIKVVYKGTTKNGHCLPYQVPSAAYSTVEHFDLSSPTSLYHPPPYCPNLNVIFPNANKTMFGYGNRWICPYPTSPTNGGFICGEFQRRYDVLFLPYKSSSLHEALAIMDSLMSEYPEYECDSSSRIGLPVKLSSTREAKYKAYIQEPGCEDRINDFIPNKKFHAFVNPRNRTVSRIDEKKLQSYYNFVTPTFPHCAKNYGKGFWASYRNGKVVIGEGNDKSGEERGVPTSILIETSYKVRSLHEFLCICETLFVDAEKTKEFELEEWF